MMNCEYAMTKLERFIKSVASIERIYGYTIGGCGCCGSPYIVDTKTDKVVMDCDDPEWRRRHDRDELCINPR